MSETPMDGGKAALDWGPNAEPAGGTERVATIRDVAIAAGVSVSTVSHVVNRTRVVSDKRRRLVLDAIAQTGYTQNAAARALRRSRSDTIGLVVSDTGQPVFAEMVRGVEVEARAAGYTLLLSNSAEMLDREEASIRALREHRVDGLVFAPVSTSPHSLIDRLRDQGTPLVVLDRLTAEDVDQVGVVGVRPMRDLVTHLIDVGHRKIAMVVGDTRVHTLADRLQGYEEALQEAGISVRPEFVMTCDHVTTRSVAAAAVATMLDAPDPPTAIANGNDFNAMAGILEAIRARSLRVPEDIAIVTFDAFPNADVFEPELTSLTQPAYLIGRQAMKLLLRRLKHPHAAPKTVRIEPALNHRRSCGCRPGTPFELTATEVPTRRRANKTGQ